MKLKRFARDAGMVLGFCGAFYLLTIVVGRLDGDTADNSDFSRTRKRADQAVERRDWNSASLDFEKLAQDDPYNGHARFRTADSYSRQRNLVLNKLRESIDSRSEEERKEMRDQINDLGAKAKENYIEAKKFARFREESLLHIAAIDAYHNRNQEALDALAEFVDYGYFTNGLTQYRSFGYGGDKYTSAAAVFDPESSGIRLHAEPRFWEIVRKESLNRER